MPFSVFRKHQRKLLAIFAILAMFSFVLSDSLPSWFGGGSGGRGPDPVIAKLNWKTIHASDLDRMRVERTRANYYVAQVLARVYGRMDLLQPFGGTGTEDLLDAIILEHEAERMGMPATIEIANKWLRQQTMNNHNAEFFADVFRRSNLASQVTDIELLSEVARQIRIIDVRRLALTAEVTPLDVFRAYREQTEKVAALAVPIRVEEFLAGVPEPSDADLRPLFEKGKTALPDPSRPEPGFLLPQKVKFETVSADQAALAARIRAELKDEELREVFKARPTEFLAPPSELPTALFANEPGLTPHDAFPEVKDQVASTVATERAQAEINAKFDTLKDEVMRTFRDRYYDTAEGVTPVAKGEALPKPGELLKTAALKAGLTYEATPLVPSTKPEGLGPIAIANEGSSASFQAPRFAAQAFSPRTRLYEPIELSDPAERRYLTWKVEDVPSREPTLEEARADVVRSWKMAKARPLAEEKARAIAEAARKAGGGEKLREAAETRPVIVTDPRSKLTPAMASNGRSFGTARPSELIELPLAGDRLREALFALEAKDVQVAPNAPEDVFYVLALKEKTPVEMASLYEFGRGPFLLEEVMQEAYQERVKDWMATLRARAGLPADWTPPPGERRDDELADAR